MINAIASPIAMNISGISKDLVLTYVGFTFFNDANFTQMTALGLFISFLGAASYFMHQYNRMVRHERKRKEYELYQYRKQMHAMCEQQAEQLKSTNSGNS